MKGPPSKTIRPNTSQSNSDTFTSSAKPANIRVYSNVTLSRWSFPASPTRRPECVRPRRAGVLPHRYRDGRSDRPRIQCTPGHRPSGAAETSPRLMGGDGSRRSISGPAHRLGDFNEWTRGPVSRRLIRRVSSHRPPAHLPCIRHTVGLPPLSLDHIYYDHHFEVERAHSPEPPVACGVGPPAFGGGSANRCSQAES